MGFPEPRWWDKVVLVVLEMSHLGLSTHSLALASVEGSTVEGSVYGYKHVFGQIDII